MIENYFNSTQASKLLKITPQRVCELARKGALHSCRVGSQHLITKNSVDDYKRYQELRTSYSNLRKEADEIILKSRGVK